MDHTAETRIPWNYNTQSRRIEIHKILEEINKILTNKEHKKLKEEDIVTKEYIKQNYAEILLNLEGVDMAQRFSLYIYT